MAKVRVLSVNEIHIQISKSPNNQADIVASGTVGTPAWKSIELSPMEKKLSPDGILDLEFVGEPPTTPVPQVLVPVSAHLTWSADVDRLIGVKVHARTNELTQLTMQGPVGGPRAAAIGAERFAGPGTLTTAALGEEGPGTFPPGENWKTLWIGEEFPKTLALGEEGPTTFAIGEEGPWPKPFRGETSPLTDDPKPPFGEGPDWPWLSGFRNPFGSR
jgi:hypothetical protein